MFLKQNRGQSIELHISKKHFWCEITCRELREHFLRRNIISATIVMHSRYVNVKVTAWHAYAGIEMKRRYSSYPFANLAPDGSRWSASHLGRFVSGKDPDLFYTRLGGIPGQSERVRKIPPHQDSTSGTSSPLWVPIILRRFIIQMYHREVSTSPICLY